MREHADVAIVGGGIVGLAFARAAARRGKSVVLFERTQQPLGASIRNFGMIWPIGQPPGPMYRLALHSRDIWREVAPAAGAWLADCGTLHAAYAQDELAVLEEYVAHATGSGIACTMLTPAQSRARMPALRNEGLLGALHTPTECCVDPRQAMTQIPRWLAESLGVKIRFGTAVTHVDEKSIRTATGETWEAPQVFVCSGTDFETLFPEIYAQAGLTRCKLQMLRTGPQPAGWRLGPHLAGGLTLCHYKAFAHLPSLPALRQRILQEYPDHVRYGIHVMASQNHLGEVLIGDSHEYDDAITPFDNSTIDDLILTYLERMLEIPAPDIQSRWHGIYAKHPSRPIVLAEPMPGRVVVAGIGGAGMTLSFGLAEVWWEAHLQGQSLDHLIGGSAA